MTENELKEIMKKDLDEVFDVKPIIDFHFDLLQKTYIKGLNTGLMVCKPKWHKVSEQVPTEEKNYLVKLTDGTIDVFYVGIDGNLEPFIVTTECFDFYKDVEKWCEIPEDN